MMGVGLFIGIIGIFAAGISAFFYTSGHEAAGILGMVVGSGLFVMGMLMFLTSFVFGLARRGFDLLLRGRFYSIDVIIRGRLGPASDENVSAEEEEYFLRRGQPKRHQGENKK